MDNFTSLITSVRGRLHRLAISVVGDADEAEDVVQEVLIKSWQKREQISGLDNAPAWLMRMTRHQAIDKLRSAKVRNQRETEAAAQDVEGRTPYRLTAANDTLSHVHRILRQLPPQQQEVLRLREVEGMEYREIAEATGLSMDKVKVYLHRGRSKMRALLQQQRIEKV